MEREQQMHEVAEQIGTILGKAVNGVRGIPDRVRKGLYLVKGQAREHAESATDAASELAQSMTERITSLRQEARKQQPGGKRRPASVRVSSMNWPGSKLPRPGAALNVRQTESRSDDSWSCGGFFLHWIRIKALEVKPWLTDLDRMDAPSRKC